ncbi:DUF4327 family protein [Anabaena sphaerica FACHB-251]|uniref:DUF4327 family protein n=1 Tax=Anabaena sphaerica FACHB-251 TaxID=2692883 RepID=A0A926WL87_9NOST|nr:DUF4327 family protein [Anabaena sphaerica]MBD2296065.1 DUF4327 family protein [Anabaena sphaerica FACHB-251]
MDTVVKYDIEFIKERASRLVSKGLVQPQQPIYTLFKYILDGEWADFEHELEKNEYLLRDRIIDLIACKPQEED